MEPPVAATEHDPALEVAGSATVSLEASQLQDQINSHEEAIGGANGTVDRVLKRMHKGKFTGAIFIHAGAGFHSHQNERVHLEACSEYVTIFKLVTAY